LEKNNFRESQFPDRKSINHKALERIYLIGFMGVGKTTLGKKLARALGYRFVDLDGLFEKKYKVHIDDFFGKYDEELFRKLEYDLLNETFQMKKTVIATGGGTPCFFDTMDKINTQGTSVYLEMTPAALASRLMNARKKRPLIEGKTGDELKAAIEKRLSERIVHYQQARYSINALHANAKDLVELLNRNSV